MRTVVRSNSKEVVIERGKGTIIIGERINPTGKKAISGALLSGNLDLLGKEAIRQTEAGANMLDVNIGAAGVDEVGLMPEALRIVGASSELPICIDSSNPQVLRVALEAYEGKALINSVTGEDDSLQRILPMARHYSAAVIGLCMDDNGIPPDVVGRLRIAAKIVEAAVKMGIPQEDIVIDCAAMAVSTDNLAARITLDTLSAIRDELGNNTVLGGSNVSFGLPDRRSIHLSFFSIAINNGLSAIIADPTVNLVRRVIRASDLLMGYDEWADRYLKDYRVYGAGIS